MTPPPLQTNRTTVHQRGIVAELMLQGLSEERKQRERKVRQMMIEHSMNLVTPTQVQLLFKLLVHMFIPIPTNFSILFS